MEIGRTHISNNTSLMKQRSDLPIQVKQQEQPQAQQYEDNSIKQSNVPELKKKIEGVNQFLKSTNTNLKFNLHEELNEYYITIIDQETKEIIKEVPPKKLLDFYASMVEALGLFIDKKI